MWIKAHRSQENYYQWSEFNMLVTLIHPASASKFKGQRDGTEH